ncbi:SDR family oxidoreductase [Paraburkholderia sp. RL17-337-BIB-A]
MKGRRPTLSPGRSNVGSASDCGPSCADHASSPAVPIRLDLRSLASLKRYGSIDEQVAPILFLASDEAGYMTGTVLPVAGGDTG